MTYFKKRLFFSAMLCGALSGCFSIGPGNLRRDHIAYDKAVQSGLQEELLMNIVHLRFGNAPIFLETQQIIANYTLGESLQGMIAGSPWSGAAPSTNGLGLQGILNFSDNPTATYQPLNGDEISAMVLAPLSPSVLLALIESGTPIDMLFSLTAGSIGGMKNVSNPLNSGPDGSKISKNFLELMKKLRTLQVDDAISIHRVMGKPPEKDKPAIPERAFLSFEKSNVPEIKKLQDEVRAMLHLPPGLQEAEIVYGHKKVKKNQFAVVTRSMLSIFNTIAATIDVPEKEIKKGRTSETITDNPDKARPLIAVHCSHFAPSNAFVSVRYHSYVYWISRNDLQSKRAFSLLQLIDQLAVNRSGKGAMVTIPVSR